MTDTKRLRQMIAHHLPNSWDHATRDLGATGTALGTWDDLPPQLQRLLNEAVHHTTTRLIQSGHLHETRPDD